MTLSEELRRELGQHPWNPGFVDYLFLAFNTSTAFSPTDVPVLSRWAKVMMILQSTISLAAVALLALATTTLACYLPARRASAAPTACRGRVPTA